MLLKQPFRVHWNSPYAAKKKRKRLYLFSLTKLIVLCFDVSNQEEN